MPRNRPRAGKLREHRQPPPDPESPMTLPTEPIGSIPRPPESIAAGTAGTATMAGLAALYDAAVRDTAFAKITARVRSTALASEAPGIA